MAETLEDKPHLSYNMDANMLAGARSAATEFGLAWTNTCLQVGVSMARMNLDWWSAAGIQSAADASRFLEAEIAEISVDRMPKDPVWEDERTILYKYRPVEELDQGHEPKDIPLVTFFAWMNDGSILGKDLIPLMLRRGYTVYRPDWKPVYRGHNNPGLEEYVLDSMTGVIEQAKADAGSGEISALGWCQGGWGATILATLQDEIARRTGRPHLGIRNLIQLTTPLLISEIEKKCGGFAEMAGDPSFNPAELVARHGNVAPGWIIDAAAKSLRPHDNYVGTHQKLWEHVTNGDEANIRRWMEMNSWTKLIRNVSGPLFVDIMEKLYKRNELAEGTLALRGMTANLANLRAVSVITVIAMADHIVRPEQTEGGVPLMGSTDLTVLRKKGGHISGISPSTCAEIEAWLASRSTGEPMQVKT